MTPSNFMKNSLAEFWAENSVPLRLATKMSSERTGEKVTL